MSDIEASDDRAETDRGQSSSGISTDRGQSSSRKSTVRGQRSSGKSTDRGQSFPGESDKGAEGQSALLLELQRMNESFTKSLGQMNDRVDQLAKTVYGPPPAKKRLTDPDPGRPSSWADRNDTILDQPDRRIDWSDSEMEDDQEDHEVADRHPSESRGSSHSSEPTVLTEEASSIMKTAFSLPLSNKDRVGIRNAFPPPELPQTRCPKLDAIFKTAASSKSEAKSTDAELARLQAYVLDPAAPHLLAKLDDPDSVSCEDVRHDVMEALRLVGNASAHISQTRRKRVIKALNPDLQDLASEDKLFTDAGPSLFGEGFEKRMRERAESVKLLVKAKSSQDKHHFFRKGRSTAPPRGSGQSNRGRSSFGKPKFAPVKK